MLLALTIVAADIWPETWADFVTSNLYAEALPAFDSAQAVASITQDNSKNAKTISGKANKVGDEYSYGFLNIHLSSAGYIGIAFSLIVGIILLAFFCSAKCKQRWRRNEQLRRQEMSGEAPPEGPKDPREPREPGILRAVARRISNPSPSDRAVAQMQLMDRIHRVERLADRMAGSQTGLDQREGTKTPP